MRGGDLLEELPRGAVEVERSDSMLLAGWRFWEDDSVAQSKSKSLGTREARDEGLRAQGATSVNSRGQKPENPEF